MTSFSNRNRERKLFELSTSVYDVLIIGGGITGAGIALDASSRGLKVLLMEKEDFASGTSSKSTKLIHGGLRYLANMQFKLVRETARERQILYQNIPHLIYPIRVLIPVYGGNKYSMHRLKLGLSLYDIMGSVPKDNRKRMLSKDEVFEMEPHLKTDKLKGGAIYKEFKTNDSRLVFETIKESVNWGAKAFNYLECISIERKGDIFLVSCNDRLSNREYIFKADSLVNAAGPWVDDIRKFEDKGSNQKLALSKGIHLVFKYEDFPVETAIYFEAKDKRLLFAIPHFGFTYLGTTDTFYYDSKDDIEISTNDVNYLIDNLNELMPTLNLNISKVQSMWAGLRPLIYEKDKEAGEISRKDEIIISENKMVSIAGGKLTGFRKMAEKVVDLIFKERLIPMEFRECITKDLKYKSSILPDDFIQSLKTNFKIDDDSEIDKLINIYGIFAEDILKNCEGDYSAKGLLRSQLEFGIEHEMVTLPSDFLYRRNQILYLQEYNLQLTHSFCHDYLRNEEFSNIALLETDMNNFKKMQERLERLRNTKPVNNFT